MKKIDVVIPIVTIDVPTFLKNLPFIERNIPVKKFVLIGSSDVEEAVKDLPNIIFKHEDCLIDGLSLAEIKRIKTEICGTDRRSGWYFQQFLKMAYSLICEDEYYLIWDSDTIPIKPIEFFDENDKPYLAYRDYVPFDECFFRTQNRLLANEDLKKSTKDSFICEHLLVNVKIMKELIQALQEKSPYRNGSFYENVMYSILPQDINLSGFSEFETYAAYVLKYHPDLYTLRYWKNLRNAKTIIGTDLSDNNIKWISTYFDVISIEDFDHQWWLFKLIVKLKNHCNIDFTKFYFNMAKPMIYNLEVIRQYIRTHIMK